MKINWGTGIAIFYVCFMIAMVSMVIKSTFHKPQMVQENYYAKDLAYEEFRQKRQNATTMTEQVGIKYLSTENAIELSFPIDMKSVNGKLTLFRPSNQFLDQSFDLKLNTEGKMLIPIDRKVQKGLWKAKIDWETDGKEFYKEETLVI